MKRLPVRRSPCCRSGVVMLTVGGTLVITLIVIAADVVVAPRLSGGPGS